MRPWTLALLAVACDNDGFTRIGTNDDGFEDTLGTDEPLDSAGACNQVESQGLCTDFVGSSYSEQEVQSNCAGGTVQPSCPTMNELGVCGLQVNTVFETRTSYYDGPFFSDANIESAESLCVLTGGEWM